MDDVTIDAQVSINNLHLAVVRAVRGVVLEQVRLRGKDQTRVGEFSAFSNHVLWVQERVIHSNDLDGLLFQGCAQHQTTDAAKTVDTRTACQETSQVTMELRQTQS